MSLWRHGHACARLESGDPRPVPRPCPHAHARLCARASDAADVRSRVFTRARAPRAAPRPCPRVRTPARARVSAYVRARGSSRAHAPFAYTGVRARGCATLHTRPRAARAPPRGGPAVPAAPVSHAKPVTRDARPAPSPHAPAVAVEHASRRTLEKPPSVEKKKTRQGQRGIFTGA